MRKIALLFFIITLLTYSSEMKNEQKEINIYIRKSSNWDNPKIVFWDNIANGKYENWPGYDMTKYDKSWFSYTIKNKKAVYVTITNGATDQTEEIYRDKDGWYYKNRWWEYNPELLKKFTFPNNKRKAIVLSFDDAVVQDKKLIKIFDKYNLKGTFHINSGLLGQKPRIEKDDLKTLYKNHELSAHTLHHPYLTTMDTESVMYQIEEDLHDIKKISGQEAYGLSYPFGSYNSYILSLLEKMNIDYARTIDETERFDMPNNFLLWNPTIHHSKSNEFLDRFIKKQSSYLTLLLIWGHSYEFDYSDDHEWNYIENFCKKVKDNDDIFWVVGAGELKHYIDSLQNVVFDYDKQLIINPETNKDVWVKKGKSSVLLKAGSNIKM